MTDQAAIENIPVELGPRSSVLEKTTPELRRKLDRAIVNYDTPGYLALYKKYILAELGISYHAFYNYARRLRRRAAACDMAITALPDERESARLLPVLVGQCLIDQLMTGDDAAPNAIYRLMLAYTAAINNAITVHDARHVFPRPSRDASQISNPEISIPPAPPSPNPVNLENPVHSLSDESDADLLAQADRVFTEQQARLDADKVQLAADFRRAQDALRAAGDPQGAERLVAEVTADMGEQLPDPQTPIPAGIPVTKSLRTPAHRAAGAPAGRVTETIACSRVTPNDDTPAFPNPQSPAPNLVNPVNPVHSASLDALVSTADDEFRITPEERRRREFHRVAIAYGLIKPDTPMPDLPPK